MKEIRFSNQALLRIEILKSHGIIVKKEGICLGSLGRRRCPTRQAGEESEG